MKLIEFVMETENQQFGKCPHYTAQKLLSGKWALIIMHYLSEGTLRFGELKDKLPDITQTTLTRQLRALEEGALVIRKIYPEVPPRVEYSLSDIGREFTHVLVSLKEWGEKYIAFMDEEKGGK